MDPYEVVPITGPLDAVVPVPGSKSIANRALICAALADGETVLDGVPGGDDSAAMLDCLTLLGVAVERGARRVRVAGGLAHFRTGPLLLPARLAGTTSRFITALAALGPGPYTIDGLPPLRDRPMAPLHDALVQLGVRVAAEDRSGHLPVSVQGPIAQSGPQVDLAGDVSSQYVSALMLIGPYVPGGLVINLTTDPVSRPYLAITAGVMAMFGVADVTVEDRRVRVGPGRYVAGEIEIEPDATSAGYPLAAAAICGGRVVVPGLADTSIQGDARFSDVLARMGCTSRRSERGTAVERGSALHGVDIDMADISDLVPTLAVVAAFADAPTTIRGVGFIRAKESDRLGDLCGELRVAGVDARETSDGLVVTPSPRATAGGAAVCLGTHHDHRLAMSFGLLGLRRSGIRIDDPGVVAKSWPGYWTMLEALR